MKRQELADWLVSQGYVEDSYGNFKKAGPDGVLRRYKFQKTSVRIERQMVLPNNEKFWQRSFSGFFSKLSITAEGKLTGFTK